MNEAKGTCVQSAQIYLEKLCKQPKSFLRRGFEDLASYYRTTGPASSLALTEPQVLAYVLSRMPATCAVAFSIIDRIKELELGLAPSSLLDLGSGPGSVLWSCLDRFASVKQVTYWESHPLFRQILSSLYENLGANNLPNFDKITVSLQEGSAWKKLQDEGSLFDMVWASYVLGELSDKDQAQLIERAFKVTSQILVLSEPGTPKGFQNLLKARSQLLKLGAYVLAPCTHRQGCPLADSQRDWCHFPVFLERGLIHQTLKNKTRALPWEVEKYAYLVVSPFKNLDFSPKKSRIIKYPLRGSSHKILDVCFCEGQKREIVSKKNKEAYKRALKKKWGDLWELT